MLTVFFDDFGLFNEFSFNSKFPKNCLFIVNIYLALLSNSAAIKIFSKFVVFWFFLWQTTLLVSYYKTFNLSQKINKLEDWRQEEKGTTEDEMIGWHHQLNGQEFEQAPGVGDG